MAKTFYSQSLFTETENKSQRLLKVCAFCFAIVSCYATTQGMANYIFHSVWQAALVSFAVQGFLFVMNLRLPTYFTMIPPIKQQHGSDKRFFFKYFILRVIIAVTYLLLLLSSSIFSYAFIVNYIYRGTAYLDADIELNSAYRNILNQTDQHLNLYIKETERGIGVTLASINAKLSNESKMSDSSGSSYADMEMELQMLQGELEDAKLTYEKKQEAVLREEIAVNESGERLNTIYGARRRTEEMVNKAEQELKDKEQLLDKALHEENMALAEVKQLNKRIVELETILKSPHSVFNSDLNKLIEETIKEEPDIGQLSIMAADMYDTILKANNGGNVSEKFIDIMNDVQNFRHQLSLYATIRSLKQQTEFKLTEDILGGADVPNSSDENGQIDLWTSNWNGRIDSLKQVIRSIPTYSVNGVNSSEHDMALQTYSGQNFIDSLDVLQRARLSGINSLERAFNFLFSRFNFLALFTFVFALLLDTFSLIAGIIVYLREKYVFEEREKKIYALPIDRKITG